MLTGLQWKTSCRPGTEVRSWVISRFKFVMSSITATPTHWWLKWLKTKSRSSALIFNERWTWKISTMRKLIDTNTVILASLEDIRGFSPAECSRGASVAFTLVKWPQLGQLFPNIKKANYLYDKLTSQGTEADINQVSRGRYHFFLEKFRQNEPVEMRKELRVVHLELIQIVTIFK